MRFRSNEYWGPYLWGFIHTITVIDFEDSERYNRDVKEILIELRDCFPCPKCRKTYKIFLERLEAVDLSKPMVLFYWSVDLHNEVNKKLSKPEWTYEMGLMKWCRKIDG